MSACQKEDLIDCGSFYFGDGATYHGQWKPYLGTNEPLLLHTNADHNTSNSNHHQKIESNTNQSNDNFKPDDDDTSISTTKEFNNNAKRMRHGKGVYKIGNNVYDGHWVEDKLNGSCKIKFESGCSYEGNVTDNVYHGYGIFKWPNNALYKGEWDHGRMHGHGEYIDEQGRTWSGLFHNGNGPGLKYHI